MTTPDADAPVETVWQGRFLTAKKQGRWEYVARARGIRAAVIVAIDEDGQLILVEQYRVPLGRACLELPAGLVGDENESEAVEIAAARELEEETGYRPGRIESLGEYFSSPGMVSESFTLVRARDLVRVGEGGGVEGEGITVHRVKLDDVPAFVETCRARGMAIDVKLLLVLGQTFLGA
ncbi:NUDIX hydrolase [Sphingomonas koreensis]|uniref:NUDIX hydrolase n=1 Tax=Sphingomonas koreensis TaxID=93064 RepID=UPI00082F6042|nr:NUDIX hydrolase [Sphingomonas koreensis]PJI88830.1 ADP-ribose pyrophosphatase [Sphingomonas koreensis]RSU63565.1 NUDIX hydrolase [Sphingomonas koreensis]RSU64284.1 NUDIX hydrolase [Sphingomonas koreensis]